MAPNKSTPDEDSAQHPGRQRKDAEQIDDLLRKMENEQDQNAHHRAGSTDAGVTVVAGCRFGHDPGQARHDDQHQVDAEKLARAP